MDPFNSYIANDDLKFPVDPLWSKGDIQKKTRILVTSTDGGKSWKAQRAGYAGISGPEAATAPAAPQGAMRLHSFLFAWYAQHPTDTDYSAITE
jgi:hypothetical protein